MPFEVTVTARERKYSYQHSIRFGGFTTYQEAEIFAKLCGEKCSENSFAVSVDSHVVIKDYDTPEKDPNVAEKGPNDTEKGPISTKKEPNAPVEGSLPETDLEAVEEIRCSF